MTRQNQPGDTWDGLEPQQPGSLPWVWIVAGLGGLVALCLLLGGGYLLLREFLEPPATPAAPIIPTVTGQPTIVGQATTDPGDEPTPTVALPPTVTLPGVTPSPLPTGGNVEAFRPGNPIVIDGSLAEWSGPVYQSAFLVYNVAGWDGSRDLEASWRLAWDENNLYIGVNVIDDRHVQTQSGNQIFKGDSLDMQFDTNRDGDFGDGLSPDDFQIIFSPGDFATLSPSAFRFQGSESGSIPDAPGHQVQLQAQKTTDGYTLEAAIPWADINVTPFEGLVIGIALNANDNDSPGAAVQEVMMSHVSTRTLTNPSGWGTLVLR